MVTFDEFVHIVDDLDIFEFRGINLYKVFYNQVSGANLKKQRALSRVSQPLIKKLFCRLILLIKALVNVVCLGIKSRFHSYTLFFGASGRNIEIDDTVYDLYNYHIVNSLGRKRVIILEREEDKTEKKYQADFYFDGLRLLVRVLMLYLSVAWGRSLKQYSKGIQEMYPDLFFEEKYIVESVKDFFASYYVYLLLLVLLAPKKTILICYYGKEPFILANKVLNIPVIELMHGVIIPSHPQYSLSKASILNKFKGSKLLPDRLGVYGPYWQQVVRHGNLFSEDSVFIAGYYLKLPEIVEYNLMPHKRRILITTQPTVQKELIEYISFLSKNLNDDEWEIVIKPHPAENVSVYASFPDFIRVSERSVYYLLGECDIHISVYSSVLYEATRYGVCNYVLFDPDYAETCEEIVSSGVARMLKVDAMPILYEVPLTQEGFYFAKFNLNSIFN